MAAGEAALFTDEELKDIAGLARGEGFVEAMCGCTSRRFGDAVGKLRVFASGDLLIRCECTPGCKEDNLTPAAFEKHSDKETLGRWKTTVWVMVRGKKVALLKTPLLKYYYLAEKASGVSRKGKGHRGPFHRDEFVRCSRCNKERRFRLRTKGECRAHHDAQANGAWQCSDFPFDNITCDNDDERTSRKALKGCPRMPSCKGCTSCVCFGCAMCRFPDCSCQICIDFTRNAGN